LAKIWTENALVMRRKLLPAQLNRIALNLLKQEATFKRDIKGKRHKDAWSLLELLGI
jgi:hypothetical protein